MRGAIEFWIDPAFSGLAFVFDVTNLPDHLETAAVVGANMADFSDAVTVGTVDNGAGRSGAPTTEVAIAGTWKYLGLIDASVQVYGASASTDRFDVDSIRLTPVPLPAGKLLLGAALAGLGFAWRFTA